MGFRSGRFGYVRSFLRANIFFFTVLIIGDNIGFFSASRSRVWNAFFFLFFFFRPVADTAWRVPSSPRPTRTLASATARELFKDGTISAPHPTPPKRRRARRPRDRFQGDGGYSWVVACRQARNRTKSVLKIKGTVLDGPSVERKHGWGGGGAGTTATMFSVLPVRFYASGPVVGGVFRGVRGHKTGWGCV